VDKPTLLHSVTGMVLAGGRGSRMGGLDKGLQNYAGRPLAHHALQRLCQQQGGALGALFVNANRNLPSYQAWARGYGAKLVPDTMPDFAGPLAGLLAGLAQCRTPYLLTVPCDCPQYPYDLALRLRSALQGATDRLQSAQIALAASADLQLQPVFCVLHVSLRPALAHYLQQGGRQMAHWAQQQGAQIVEFNQRGDDAQAFANINTPEQLHHYSQS
jgi:molybdenum cofactor guanylyltransferase